MSNIILNPGAGGSTLATDLVGGIDTQVVKIGVSDAGAAPVQVGPSNPLPVTILTAGATQPVSGTVAATQSGAWTVAATQSGAWSAGRTWTLSSATDSITTVPSGTQTISGTVSISGSVAVTGTFWQATQPVSIATMPTTPTTPDGTVWTLTGTSANVNVTNASIPVTGTFWQATQPVSGTVTANAGTGNFTVAQATAANLNATVTGTVAATQSGTWNIGSITTLPAITGTVTANQGTANATPWNENISQYGGTAVSPTNPFNIQPSATYFASSVGNSSTAQLAAGATFTGAIESTLSQQALSLLITCDQPFTAQLLQFIDAAGTYALPVITLTGSSSNAIMRSFVLNGNYFQIKVTNNGTATTTLLNINSYYGTIMPSNSSGNEAVSLYDAQGITVGSGIYGGNAYLHVDPSIASSDSVPFNTSNVPQVGVNAAWGNDGNVHTNRADPYGALSVIDNPMIDLLTQILAELKLQTNMLVTGLGMKDNPDDFRNDPTYFN